jgi:hypothetical protein
VIRVLALVLVLLGACVRQVDLVRPPPDADEDALIFQPPDSAFVPDAAVQLPDADLGAHDL